jgi:hypothetical protein
VTGEPFYLQRFKSELWKDQRRLETRDQRDRLTLIKHFASLKEGETELYVLSRLSGEETERRHVPAVFASSDDRVELEYIKGIRLFNLLVELDQVSDEMRSDAEEVGAVLLSRADENQREIQRILRESDRLPHWRPYQAGSKILAIVQILAPVLDLAFDADRLRNEICDFDSMWAPLATVPFRDATTKNMVLAAPELWLGNFDGEDARRSYLIETLRGSNRPRWLSADLIDFDFASCGELSTPEDDYISLHFHERTWREAPVHGEALVWTGEAPDSERAALSFITRYYRFGGRKAAYRLLHPWGHRVRFRHDRDAFYFERLPDIVGRLSLDVAERFPVLMDVTGAIARTLDARRPGIDQFIAAGLAEKRNYFVDMYWDSTPDPTP